MIKWASLDDIDPERLKRIAEEAMRKAIEQWFINPAPPSETVMPKFETGQLMPSQKIEDNLTKIKQLVAYRPIWFVRRPPLRSGEVDGTGD